MSRAKPYDRRDRNPDAPWKHDLHNSNSLAARLDSGRGSSSSASPSLLNRIGSDRGKELLPDRSRGAMYGFDRPSPNAGVELLPSSSSTKSTRPSRARRGGDDAGRALAAKSIAAITQRVHDREALNIVGSARSCWVRVERLAKHTTAEDVKSAFAHHPIGTARVTSRASDPTVTVELEMPDREAAGMLVKEYDGVPADGETLRVGLVGERKDLGARLRRHVESERPARPAQPERSGKMYADQMADTPVITVPQTERTRSERAGSLASRMGRR
ncbi:hypothetical protein CspeluHIS016_0503660 [Cutaneotrichosporon spelunceum]|uniref:RRM domain-containing protein n=1 Tax=Cutaneotrichosporon spelunceum TaxID=1672016 RepID=A0AAD3TWX3_9TREE|nr:hypothetical protein CspeluHIS016_0503660 [Cutaneotrichosporon spelunceum]